MRTSRLALCSQARKFLHARGTWIDVGQNLTSLGNTRRHTHKHSSRPDNCSCFAMCYPLLLCQQLSPHNSDHPCCAPLVVQPLLCTLPPLHAGLQALASLFLLALTHDTQRSTAGTISVPPACPAHPPCSSVHLPMSCLEAPSCMRLCGGRWCSTSGAGHAAGFRVEQVGVGFNRLLPARCSGSSTAHARLWLGEPRIGLAYKAPQVLAGD